ncbi:tetratricopeptide repeat protein [Lentzea sp. NPDC060358]|uniref:tetratricopeptide repeat protein n=1 Tax=Lentzea sp. NPDC060358 TaxID=3347103 RepID=UPI00365881E6
MPEDLPSVSNAFDGTAGQVFQIGVVEGDVVLGASRPSALPLQVGVVPPRAASFQHRDAPVAERALLIGTGGVGKTQLAAEHARALWDAGEVRLLVWVTATSRDAISSAYADAATKLAGAQRDAQAFLEWLATTAEPWLVVLDDLRKPSDLTGLWPPETGRVVVTTRRQDASLRGERLLVGTFTPDEARKYLSSVVGADDDVARLADELGHLPLALAQAGACVLDRHLSCAEYLARFSERRLELMAPDELPDDHRATVAATWALSVEHADSLTPRGVARPLLDIASALDPNGIPVALFTSPAVLEFVGVDAADARDGLSCLHRLSLVTLGQDVRVHALVQRATRDTWTDPAAVVRVAADALTEVWPDEQRRVLHANAEALRACGDRWLWRENCHPLLFRWGIDVGTSTTSGAVEFFAELGRTSSERLGPDHPDSLRARGLLVQCRSEVSDPAAAATEYQRLLEVQERVLGPDHVDTLFTRRSLVMCRGRSGSPAEATAALRDLLADQVRVLGPDHPQTLTTRGNIAFLLARAGDLRRAVAATEALVADQVRVLGSDDLQTMVTRQNLADLRGESGDLAAAVTGNRRLLADRLRVLGPDHPLTWASRGNLVHWLHEAGDMSAAAAECRELLREQVRVLGARHPEVRKTRESFLYLTERV